MTLSEFLISLAIIGLVLLAAWRGGQNNPVGTGRLARRMDALELKVGEHGTRLDGIERSVLTLASTAQRIDEGVQSMRIEVASDRGVTERTWEAVDRMQRYFVEEGLRARKEGR